MEEVWLPVVGYESRYEVSSYGQVRSKTYMHQHRRWAHSTSIKNGKILKQQQIKNGYVAVKIGNKPHSITKTIHRLVALSFLPNPENKSCVNHKNGIKNDNRIENLEWCTKSENGKHAFQKGLLTQMKKLNLASVKAVSKPVNMFTISGTFVRRFNSVAEATRLTNCFPANVLRGRDKQSNGFTFAYC